MLAKGSLLSVLGCYDPKWVEAKLMDVITGSQDSTNGMNVDRDSAGRITVAPVTGFGLTLVAGTICLLRIEFARTPEQLRGTREAVQLGLTPDQALRLARELTATAKAAVRPTFGKLKN